MAPRLKKASKLRAFEKVSERIRQDLADGALKVGDKLPAERTLALNLGVSRPAVREALRTLEVSGLLKFEAGMAGGAFIRERSSDGLKRTIKDMVLLGAIPVSHLTEVRACLLGYAARLAAERATDADITALRNNINASDGLAARDDLPSLTVISEFYRLIGRASHNEVMSVLVDSMSDLLQELLIALQLHSTVDLVTPRHMILARIEARDGDGADRLIREHLFDLTRRWPVTNSGGLFLS